MAKINVTYLVFADGKTLGVTEEGKEVTRRISKFLGELNADDAAPKWLELTNQKLDGGRSLFIHERNVQMITMVSDVSIADPEAPKIQTAQMAGDPFSVV